MIDAARQVRVALWLARMYGHDADAIDYAYPVTDQDRAESDALRNSYEDMCDHAARLCGWLGAWALPDGVWREAWDSFDDASLVLSGPGAGCARTVRFADECR